MECFADWDIWSKPRWSEIAKTKQETHKEEVNKHPERPGGSPGEDDQEDVPHADAGAMAGALTLAESPRRFCQHVLHNILVELSRRQ